MLLETPGRDAALAGCRADRGRVRACRRPRSCSTRLETTSAASRSRSPAAARSWCRATRRHALRERVAPALSTLLAATLDREELTREVVETAALRRSDELKTAILRSVSHDLRSPLTAMVAAGEALGSPDLPDEDRRELAAAIAAEGARLTRLVEKLLDLSRLQAGTATPRRDWCSLEEVIRAAAEGTGAKLSLDADLPLIEADAAQLERAFANLLENAVRHSGGRPVSVRARVTAAACSCASSTRAQASRRRAGADLRAVLRHDRLRPRAGDRQGLRRGQRRPGARRVAARPGRLVRRHVPAPGGRAAV